MITLTAEQAQQIEEALVAMCNSLELPEDSVRALATIRAARAQEQAEPEQYPTYGFCPICGSRGISRERRINGNDTCANGHSYASNLALHIAPEKQAEQEPVIECDCETSISSDGSRLTKCGSDQMRRAVEQGHAFCKQQAEQEQAEQEPVAGEIESAYIHIFGGRKNWLKEGGSYFIEGFKAGKNAAPQPVKQGPEYKGWYCAHCERGVDGSEVTFHEQHEVCGRVITNDVSPKPVMQEPVAWKDLTYGNLHHQDFGNSTPLYTRPVRTKDLTDDEIHAIAIQYDAEEGISDVEYGKRVIAAYKEKNK